MSPPSVFDCWSSSLQESEEECVSLNGPAPPLILPGNTEEIVYPGLKIVYDVDFVNEIVDACCISKDKDQRPMMSEVLQVLERDINYLDCISRGQSFPDPTEVSQNPPKRQMRFDSLSPNQAKPNLAPAVTVPLSTHTESNTNQSEKQPPRVKAIKTVSFYEATTSSHVNLTPSQGYRSRQKSSRSLFPGGKNPLGSFPKAKSNSSSFPADSNFQLRHHSISYSNMAESNVKAGGSSIKAKPNFKALQYETMLCGTTDGSSFKAKPNFKALQYETMLCGSN